MHLVRLSENNTQKGAVVLASICKKCFEKETKEENKNE